MDGLPGPTGPTGMNGLVGPTGPAGATGPAGTFDPAQVIGNQTTQQANANFNISGNGVMGGSLQAASAGIGVAPSSSYTTYSKSSLATVPAFFGTAPTNSATASIAEFRHDNLTQGVGIGYRSIFATGTNANQDLSIFSRGTGNLFLNGEGGANVSVGGTTPIAKLSVQGIPNQRQVAIGDAGCGVNFGAISVAGAMSGCTNYSLLGDGANTYLNAQGGQILVRNNNNTVMNIDANGNGGWLGNLTVNTSNRNACAITVDDDSCLADLQNGAMNVRNPANTAWVVINAAGFGNASSREWKKDITPLGAADFATFRRAVDELPVYNYRYKDEPESRRPHTGLIAEETPRNIVSPDGKTVDLYDYLTVTVGATKALSADEKALKARVEQLDAENAKLRRQNQALEQRLDRIEQRLSR